MRQAVLGLMVSWLLLALPAQAQEFGQNKIQYRKQEWYFLQSEHFDIYYYEGGQRAAEFTAAIAESSYHHLSRSLNYTLIERIPILIYNSHHDFEETNVTPGIQPESVGGFTEFFKNRVVIPYEGSLEQFRHVIHHELTHAISLQFYYGAGPGAILRGLARLQLPLWYVEGLAEYESLGWDTESDMFVRDATINGYLPPIEQLSAYMAYKGGQAFWYYIEQRYGSAKVTELLNTVRSSGSVEAGIRRSLGLDVRKLSDKWQKYLREWYWPEIARRDTPEQFASPLTDHVKSSNFINNSPALSPKGDLIAFLSDRSGFFDIYLMSTLDRRVLTKLVSGQRTAAVEELHWLRPGISWSPDGKRIIFAAKSGSNDVLYIVDVKKGKIVKKLRFDLDAAFSPAWSPNGVDIAFVGLKDAQTDLYSFNLETGKLTQLTNDPFSDLEPSWAPDGREIAFTSDRGQYVQGTDDVDLPRHNYRQTDIYILNIQTGNVERVTSGPSLERSPAFLRGPDSLLFVSDRNGIFNIYLHDRRTGAERPLTNLLTGANQLSVSRDSERLAFVSFYKGGYDIYLWKQPLENLSLPDTLMLTDFMERQKRLAAKPEPEKKEEVTAVVRTGTRRPYLHYYFGEGFTYGAVESKSDTVPVTLPEEVFRTPTGEFRKHKYTPKFSLDYAGAVGGYDPFFGLQGFTQFVISDLLGNHQIALQANLNRSLDNSNYFVAYSYLPLRPDFSFVAYHLVYFFQTGFGIERFRNFGAGATMRYPINRFQRIDLTANWFAVTRENLSFPFPPEKINTILMSLGYTTDNTLWAYTGPFAGTRSFFNVTFSPKIGASGLGFTTLTGDFRHYIRMGREYSLGLRLAGGASFGPNPTRFLLGGVANWVNFSFARNIEIDIIRDFFFSQFVFPLRGANYYEQIGTRYMLSNIEFKFPFIQYFITRFPLALGFANIRGAGFLDVGAAWEGNNFRAVTTDADGRPRLQDLIAGFGWGIRMNVGFGLLRIDQAWRTDLRSTSKPKYYFSFGVDF
jgi:Tol biopolymer transport system component